MPCDADRCPSGFLYHPASKGCLKLSDLKNDSGPDSRALDGKTTLWIGWTSMFQNFGAFFGIWASRQAYGPSYVNNIFAQIGLIMLIGLAAKNAILIVEFAKVEYEKGMDFADAALEGARLRLRPILMTSFAFILGCVPLALASGSGAIARKVMGTAVIGGMAAATAIAIFLVPVTFYVVEKFSHRKGKEQPTPAAALADPPADQGEES